MTGNPPACTDTTLYTNSFEGESGLSDWSVGSFNGGSTADWAGVQNPPTVPVPTFLSP